MQVFFQKPSRKITKSPSFSKLPHLFPNQILLIKPHTFQNVQNATNAWKSCPSRSLAPVSRRRTSWLGYCWLWFRNSANSPVEVGSLSMFVHVYLIIYKVFSTIPGGWEWISEPSTVFARHKIHPNGGFCLGVLAAINNFISQTNISFSSVIQSSRDLFLGDGEWIQT